MFIHQKMESNWITRLNSSKSVSTINNQSSCNLSQIRYRQSIPNPNLGGRKEKNFQ